ncbi:hypothetical protein SCB49_04635 [unidentified eubacterium SCB49]|nr:hypothetical protein SCB49_04635 [unidentified eubacterium SCB49]
MVLLVFFKFKLVGLAVFNLTFLNNKMASLLEAICFFLLKFINEIYGIESFCAYV